MWQVTADPERTAHLQAQPWVDQHLQTQNRALEILPGGSSRFPLKADKTCVFLDEAHRCLIQVNEGPAAKPLDCQRFPFAAVPTPQAPGATQPFAYDLTASCITVAQTLLLAFGNVQPQPTEEAAAKAFWQQRYAFAQKAPRHARRWPAPLGFYQPLPWPEAANQMAHLARLAQDPLLSPEAFLLLAGRFLFTGTGKQTCWIIDAQVFGFKLARWQQTLIEACFLRRPYGLYSLKTVLFGGLYQDSGLLGAGVTVDWQALKQVSTQHRPHLRIKAFLWQVLCRKTSLYRGHSWLGLYSLAWVACGLLNTYAQLFAITEGLSQTEEAHWSMAIRTVERYYTAHRPGFLALFAQHPACAWLGGLFLRA